VSWRKLVLSGNSHPNLHRREKGKTRFRYIGVYAPYTGEDPKKSKTPNQFWPLVAQLGITVHLIGASPATLTPRTALKTIGSLSTLPEKRTPPTTLSFMQQTATTPSPRWPTEASPTSGLGAGRVNSNDGASSIEQPHQRHPPTPR
jgi:hypothetical protein